MALIRTCESPDTKQIVIELPQAESQRSEADERTMRTIASKRRYALRGHEMDKLAELVPPGRLRVVRDEQHTLWDTPLMLLIIATLLTVEWVVRKRCNMA